MKDERRPLPADFFLGEIEKVVFLHHLWTFDFKLHSFYLVDISTWTTF